MCSIDREIFKSCCRQDSQHVGYVSLHHVAHALRGTGLDYAHARLDRSAHPFCGGTPSDVRITTRYDEADFAQSLWGVLHETGHALYERGLPAANRSSSRGRPPDPILT